MSDAGYLGTMDLGALGSEYNLLSFIIDQHLGKMATIELVQVKAVYGGGLAAVGTVDVQPMVNQIDGQGNATAHGIIYGVPYFRIQGGSTAIIIDPVIGDIGLCAFAAHDISSVKATQAVANPGSRRRFAWSDGLYFGGFLGAVPTRYIMAGPDGITICDPSTVTIDAPATETTGNLAAGNGVTGSFTTPTGQTVTIQNGIVTNIY
jgi:hypothetical protein